MAAFGPSAPAAELSLRAHYDMTTMQGAPQADPTAATPLTILIIDDEPQIRRIIRTALQTATTRVVEAKDGSTGLDLAATERPQLVVLDLGLPDMSGADVCRALREWTRSPILVLSARHSDAEKVALLDSGADDYVTKPFSTSELQARVRALLRRSARSDTADAETRINSGDLAMDLVARTLTVHGQYVHLTRTEWELLRALATQAGRTMTHQQLFQQVWSGRSYGDAQQYLRVQVAHLRRKIEDDVVRPRYIVTEPGVGYRFNLIEQQPTEHQAAI
jgi:two-component system KDP operon response regulator KdpE